MSARILVVEDDDDVRGSLAEVLELSGFVVEVAANGREALEAIQKDTGCPSLILLDMMMPVMNGWALMEELKKDARLSSIPIVIFSAHRNPAGNPMAIAPKAVLSKPVTMDDLIKTVTRCAVTD